MQILKTSDGSFLYFKALKKLPQQSINGVYRMRLEGCKVLERKLRQAGGCLSLLSF